MRYFYITIITLFFLHKVSSQDTFSEILKKSSETFRYKNNNFEGKGWETVLRQINKHNNILVGEDHFFNEIPLFISKITSEIRFDNFFVR
ncbi:hypothetical protein BSU00_00020 [Tenacibaculum sp. SG-28]|nr:hypothetical protein BSU00_00020 [Tenacibaculum sp. SG-28]